MFNYRTNANMPQNGRIDGFLRISVAHCDTLSLFGALLVMALGLVTEVKPERR
jgi:hypothetical protein